MKVTIQVQEYENLKQDLLNEMNLNEELRAKLARFETTENKIQKQQEAYAELAKQFEFQNQAAIAESQAFMFDLKEANEQKVGLRKANILCARQMEDMQKHIEGLETKLTDLNIKCEGLVIVGNQFAEEAREAKAKLAEALKPKDEEVIDAA